MGRKVEQADIPGDERELPDRKLASCNAFSG
jgi:hypothetical protein